MSLSHSKTTILSSVRRFRRLSAYQILHLHYSLSAESTVFAHCRFLAQDGYISPAYLEPEQSPKRPLGGRNLALWALTEKGARALRSAGLFSGPYRPPTKEETSKRHLPHLKLANDLLIAAIKAGQPLSYKTEYELRGSPTAQMVADGWVEYEGLHLHLELDRGTIAETEFRVKIGLLARYLPSTKVPSKALFLMPNRERWRQVGTWAWKELKQINATGAQDHFGFGVMPHQFAQQIELVRKLAGF